MKIAKWLVCLILITGLFSTAAYASGTITIQTEISESETEKNDVIVPPEAVTSLKAVGIGQSRVKIMWNASEGADGYLVYGIRAGASYGYIGYTSNTSLIDNQAGTTGFNYYWVFPYVYDANGKMIHGACPKYVYAQGVNPYKEVVTGVKATNSGGRSVSLTWDKLTNVHGYAIYRKNSDGILQHIGSTSNTQYVDRNAESLAYNYYWVYPYVKLYGETIYGGTEKYVYAKGGLDSVEALKLTSLQMSNRLSWKSVVGAEGYLIYRSTDGNSFKYLNMTSDITFEDVSCVPGTKYYYKVFPYVNVNGKMQTAPSQNIVGGYILKPLPVQNLQMIDDGEKGICLQWDASAAGNEEGYLVFRIVEGKEDECIYDMKKEYLISSTLRFIDQKADRKQNYTYKVYTYNSMDDEYILSDAATVCGMPDGGTPEFTVTASLKNGANAWNPYIDLRISNYSENQNSIYVHNSGTYTDKNGETVTLNLALNRGAGIIYVSSPIEIPYFRYDMYALITDNREEIYVPAGSKICIVVEFEGILYDCEFIMPQKGEIYYKPTF